MNRKIPLLMLSVLVFFALSACGKSAPLDPQSELESKIGISLDPGPPEPTRLPPTLIPTPTPTLLAVYTQSKACLDCHSDKQALIANAKPEKKKESENEGVG